MHENNIENASQITGLTPDEIQKFIDNHRIFSSDDDKTVLDSDKVKNEMKLWSSELLIECIVIDGLYEDSIDDYCQ